MFSTELQELHIKKDIIHSFYILFCSCKHCLPCSSHFGFKVTTNQNMISTLNNNLALEPLEYQKFFVFFFFTKGT